jgi:RWD domain
MTTKGKHGPPKSTPAAFNQGPTDYAEIQQNELAVLQSIYMEDFEEVKVKAAAWNVRLRIVELLPTFVDSISRNPQISRSDFA